MKTRLTWLALTAALLGVVLLWLPSGARAQSTPTYRSFNTNQFYTNGSAPIKINVVTNWPTLVITNIYASNIYVTNIYASNIVSGDIIWTNAGPYITPLPFTNAFQITTNGAVLAGKSVWPWWNPDADDAFISVSDIATGETGVRKLYIAGVDDAASPTNYSSGRFQVAGGATPSGQINLASTLAGSTSRFTVEVQPDTSVANIQLYNNGVLTFGVNDVSGYSGTGTNFLSDDGTYKQGVGTTINPTDQFLPYRFDGATFEDSPLYRIDPNTIGVDTIDANVIAATNLQSGGVVYSRNDGILTNVVNGTGFLFNDGSNTNLVWAGGSLSDICLWTNRSSMLQPVDNSIPLFWTNSVVFGPGTTNSLLRSGRNLVWTNSDVTSQGNGFVTRDGSGNEAQFIVAGSSAMVRPGSGGNAADLNDGTRTVRWASGYLSPISVTANLGQLGGGYYPWSNINTKGTTRIYGFEDITTGGTNSSYLSIFHTGTNGVIALDSQSAGTAGIPRDFEFRTNGSAILTIQPSGIGIGPNSDVGEALNAAYVASLGDPNALVVNFWNRINPSYDSYANYSSTLFTNGLTSTWAAYSGLNNSAVVIDVTVTNATITAIVEGSASIQGRISPACAAVDTPFFFASTNRVSGNLMEVNNFTTNIFVVTSQGPVILRPITKAQKTAITPSEGMFAFQSDNTPGLRVYQSGAWMMVSTVADP